MTLLLLDETKHAFVDRVESTFWLSICGSQQTMFKQPADTGSIPARLFDDIKRFSRHRTW
jgi:hypothetical protein